MDTYPTNMIKSNIVGSAIVCANDISTLGQTMLHIHEYKTLNTNTIVYKVNTFLY